MTHLATDDVVRALRGVDDPEYPGISIVELGLVETVRVDAGRVEVDLVPTFSGCPALTFIAEDAERVVGTLPGVSAVQVRFVTEPAWTPARIAASAVTRLAGSFGVGVQVGARPAPCPSCGAAALREQSMFGSSRCRSVHRCTACGEVVELIS